MLWKAKMRRHELTDEQFKKIEHILPGREGHVGVTAKDNRIFINGALWIFKTGAPWRDLPEKFGHWKNVHRRFSRWAKAGIFDSIFRILSEDADMEFLLMDGTIVKAHQHAAGAKKNDGDNNEGLGRSKGGLSSKILDKITQLEAIAVIPPRTNRKEQRGYDRHYYKDRNLIERFFCRLKQFRGIATRYCKRGKYFLEAVKLASSIILMS